MAANFTVGLQFEKTCKKDVHVHSYVADIGHLIEAWPQYHSF
jgi:hypothetical protein